MRKLICLLVIVFGFGAGIAHGQRQTATEVGTTAMRVKNITCSSCLLEIGSRLRQLEGYEGVDADLNHGLLFLKHRPVLDENAVAAYLTTMGYPADIISMKKAEEIRKTRAASRATAKKGCCDKGCGASSSAWRELMNRVKGSGE